MEILILILIVSVFWGFVCSKMAESRGRGKTLAFVLGFFFGLFAVIGYAIAGRTKEKEAEVLAKVVKAVNEESR